MLIGANADDSLLNLSRAINHASADAWSSATAYVIGDRVLSGGLVYACIANNTNFTPASNPAKWSQTYSCAAAHPTVFAATYIIDHSLILSYNAAGVIGNAATLAKSAATLSLGGATFGGGVDGGSVRGSLSYTRGWVHQLDRHIAAVRDDSDIAFWANNVGTVNGRGAAFRGVGYQYGLQMLDGPGGNPIEYLSFRGTTAEMSLLRARLDNAADVLLKTNGQGVLLTTGDSTVNNYANLYIDGALAVNRTTAPSARLQVDNSDASGTASLRLRHNDGVTEYGMAIWPHNLGSSMLGYQFKVTNGATTTTPLEVVGSGLIVSGAIAGSEITPPGAPAADGGILYFQDNGAGKTQLMCLFATGAAQQVAIQP